MMTTNCRVLVGAHPHKMTYKEKSFQNHWCSKMVFDPIIDTYYAIATSVVVETADVMENSDRYTHNHTVDMFDGPTEFAATHANFYDVVFLPDAGGMWYYCQEPECNKYPGMRLSDQHKTIIAMYKEDHALYVTTVQAMVQALLNLVKPGGHLWLSKFTNVEFESIVKTYLEAQGCAVTTLWVLLFFFLVCTY